jgi:hypothetical protein
MRFDPNAYGRDVAGILALDGDGERLMPLTKGLCSSQAAYRLLQAADASKLFAGARSPEAAMSGMYLYFSCLDEAHEIAQRIETPEGSFWHGIMHRQEPDPGNATYWFRQVGTHPIFPALHQAAAEAGLAFGVRWDPVAFVDFCEEARQRPGSKAEQQALVVQRAEWQLLFDFCAAKD